MLILFAILVILAAVILGFIVLIQNPKGGGLSGTFGGLGNQLMGVKQSTDIMEKGTWLFAGIIGVLCLLSPLFIPKGTSSSLKNENYLKTSAPVPKTNTPAATPMPSATPAPADSPKQQ
jgi:preprotein translocase subunit SecG